jgi:hypothetical protein
MITQTVNSIIGPLHILENELRNSQYKLSPNLKVEGGVLPLVDFLGAGISIVPTGKFHCHECLSGYVGAKNDICDLCLNPLAFEDSEPHVIYLAVSQGVFIGSAPIVGVQSHWSGLGASKVLPVAKVLSKEIASDIIKKTGLRDESVVKPVEFIIGPKGDIDFSRYEALIDKVVADVSLNYGYSRLVTKTRHYEHLRPSGASRNKLSLNKEVKGVFLGVVGNYLLLDCGYVDLIQCSGVEVNIKLG